jgi:hypothetical protein
MEDHTIDGQPRTNRRYSTYDTSLLPTMADKLLFILTYLKQNPIHEVQGQLCGMSQAHANKWIHLLHTVLNQAFAQHRAESGLRSARTAARPHRCRISDAPAPHTSEGGGHVPPVWHDGTERPIHRPRDAEEQQEYYSGRKKCHTLKNLLGSMRRVRFAS